MNVNTTINLSEDFVPTTDAKIIPWANSLMETIPTAGATLGLLPADITKYQDASQALIDAINKVAIKRNELADAIAEKEMIKANSTQLIRQLAGAIKRMDAYSLNIGKQLGLVASSQPVDVTALKPTLKLVAFPGYINVAFNKQRMWTVNIYSRLQGATQWERIGQSKTSPFVDSRPLKEINKPEIREYAAICYNGDREIGQMSEISAVAFGIDSNSITY